MNYSTKMHFYLLVLQVRYFEKLQNCMNSNQIEPNGLHRNFLNDLVETQFNNRTMFNIEKGIYEVDVNPCLESSDRCSHEPIYVPMTNIINCAYFYKIENNDKKCANSNVQNYYLKIQSKSKVMDYLQRLDNYFKNLCIDLTDLALQAQYTCINEKEKCLQSNVF